MHQSTGTTAAEQQQQQLSNQELPEESPSLLYPSQLATEEPVTPPFTQQPLTQENPLLLHVLEAPRLSGNNTKENKMPTIPAPRSLEGDRGSLTQDLRQDTHQNNNDESQRCLVDFCEWWCHKIIASEDPEDIQLAEVEFQKAMSNLAPQQKLEFGRFYNRMQLAALSLDVGVLRPGKKPQDASSDYYSGDLGPDTWKMYREQLILLKSLLVRTDANVDHTSETSTMNATPDREREQHPLFQTEYRKVARLLKVQEYLAAFRQELLEASKNDQKDQQGHVQQAVDKYEGKMNILYGETEVDNDDDDCSAASLISQNHQGLPQELVGFLLKDLYRSKKTAAASPSSTSTTESTSSSSSAEQLPQRLLRHVDTILFDDSDSGQYSHATARHALRHLLQQWQTHVLEVPTLVELGYGMDPKTASPNQRRAEAEEDAMLRRLSSSPHENHYDDVSDFGDSSDSEASATRKRKASNDESNQQNKKKKKEFVPVKWESSSSSDEEESEAKEEEEEVPFQPRRGSMAELSSLYARSRRRTPLKNRRQPQRPSSPLSSDAEEDGQDQQKRQRPFTEEETQAILEGVKKYGVGKWRLIKDNCGGKLDDRDNMQIKDKYRNLLSRGLV